MSKTFVAIKTVDRDLGWKKIKDRIVADKGSTWENGVRVGYWSPSQKNKEGMTIAEYALINEYGTALFWRNAIPPRPFMARAFDDGEAGYHSLIARLHGLWTLGQITLKAIMVYLGNQARNDVVKTIRNANAWATPNAPSTIARKHSTGVLRDTGAMMRLVWWDAKVGGIPVESFTPGKTEGGGASQK